MSEQFGYPEEEYAVTDFSIRCDVLGLIFQDQDSIKDEWSDLVGLDEFIDFHNIGLPLAYSISTDIIEPSLGAKKHIDAAWQDLMSKTINGDNAFGGIPASDILNFILEDWES
jgi:hypothetical protein